MNDLKNKNVLITGASSGIGKATAKMFIESGAKVWVTARDEKKIKEFYHELKSENFEYMISDTSKISDIENIVEFLKKQKIKLDVLFINAGVAQFNMIEHTTEQEFDNQFAINVKGAYFTLQKVLPFLNTNASVIFNASTNATASAIGSSIYSATKAALVKIAKIAANELANRNIRVNIVSPGPTKTPGLEEAVPSEGIEAIASKTALQRLGSADEISKAVLFLASNQASFITGTELIVDGGLVNYSLS